MIIKRALDVLAANRSLLTDFSNATLSPGLFRHQNDLRGFASPVKNGEGTDIMKLSSQHFSTGHNITLFDF